MQNLLILMGVTASMIYGCQKKWPPFGYGIYKCTTLKEKF